MFIQSGRFTRLECKSRAGALIKDNASFKKSISQFSPIIA